MPILLAALAALATPPALAPLDFLVGHCWRGTLKTQDIDTHCFDVSDGHVRDRHQVVRGGKPVYRGETLYAWDEDAKAIAFTYTDMTGGVEKGHVRRTPQGLDFGEATYTDTDGSKMTIVTQWVVNGRSYEARTRMPADASMNGNVIYSRVD